LPPSSNSSWPIILASWATVQGIPSLVVGPAAQVPAVPPSADWVSCGVKGALLPGLLSAWDWPVLPVVLRPGVAVFQPANEVPPPSGGGGGPYLNSKRRKRQPAAVFDFAAEEDEIIAAVLHHVLFRD
jgi:hypothetical protein